MVWNFIRLYPQSFILGSFRRWVVFRLIFVLIGTELFSLGAYVEIIFAIMVALSAILMMKKKRTLAFLTFQITLCLFVKFFVLYILSSVLNLMFRKNSKEENKHIVLKRKGSCLCNSAVLMLFSYC